MDKDAKRLSKIARQIDNIEKAVIRIESIVSVLFEKSHSNPEQQAQPPPIKYN